MILLYKERHSCVKLFTQLYYLPNNLIFDFEWMKYQMTELKKQDSVINLEESKYATR